MNVDTLFSEPIEVEVEAEWHEYTYSEALAGFKDYITKEAWVGKLIGTVNLHVARIVHFVVVDKDGKFWIKERHKVKALNYESI